MTGIKEIYAPFQKGAYTGLLWCITNEKMTRGLLVLLFLSIGQYSFSQSYLLKGQILDGQSLYPREGVYIGFNQNLRTITDSTGHFELRCDEHLLNDSLKIYSIFHYKLSIINLPKDSIINLGQIPLFEYEFGTPLVSFDCGRFDFICNHRRKKYWKKFKKERSELLKKIDPAIGYYRLIYNGNLYSIDVKNHLIDLRHGK